MSSFMQICFRTGGPWHRRVHQQSVTACGLQIVGAYLSRDWQLDDLLCPECFTPRERDTGELQKLERDSLDSVEDIAFGDEDEDTAVDLPTVPKK